MKKITIAVMIALTAYSAIAFAQTPLVPFPNPVDNDNGCYIAIILPDRSTPELYNIKGDKLGAFSRGAAFRDNNFYYYFDTAGLPNGKYKIDISAGIKDFTILDGSGRCADIPQPRIDETAGAGSGGGAAAPPSGGISRLVLTKVMRALLNIQTAMPLIISILPSSGYVSSENPNKEITYTLTLRNPNTLSRLTAFVENVEKGTLSIRKPDNSDLSEGALVQLNALQTGQINLKASAASGCESGCMFTLRISSKKTDDQKLLGASDVNATYTITAAPPPGIRVAGAAEKEGAINTATKRGSPVEFTLEVFHPPGANEGLLPYDVRLDKEVLTENKGWGSGVRFYRTADGRKAGSSITSINLTVDTKVMQIIAEVTPPSSNVNSGDFAEIKITVKRPGETQANDVTIKYTISHHGDGVCDEDERGTSLPEEKRADCKPETNFVCSGAGGACSYLNDERNGVAFSAQVNGVDNIDLYDFIVCAGGSSADDCVNKLEEGGKRAENCKFGSSKNGPWTADRCISADLTYDSGFFSSSQCADAKGTYYFLADEKYGTRRVQSANTYSYECPFIGINAIAGKYALLDQAERGWRLDMSSMITKNANPETPPETKAANAICIDTYMKQISFVSQKKNELESLRTNPSLGEKERIFGGNSIDRWYEDFFNPVAREIVRGCSGAQSILQITAAGFRPVPVQKGEDASIVVNAARRGDANYYGSVKCRISRGGAAGETIILTDRSGTQCVNVLTEPETEFVGTVNVGQNPGALSAVCELNGSLSSTCAGTSVHDTRNIGTTVYTNDISISSSAPAGGTCRAAAGSVQCLVTLSGNEVAKTGFAGHPLYADSTKTCAACDIVVNGARNKCVYTGRSGTNPLVSVFNCAAPGPGTYQLRAYVSGEGCNPAEQRFSAERTAADSVLDKNALCEGVGDGSINGGEQCDLSYTSRNLQQQCPPRPVVDGKKVSTESATSCSSAGQCVYEAGPYACSKSAGAECDASDRTQAQTPITLPDGRMCTPVRACNPNTCIFATTECVPTNIALSITPELPTRAQDVTITATVASGITNPVLRVDSIQKTLVQFGAQQFIHTVPKGTLALGQHTAVLTATDASGNTYQTTNTFTVQNAAPAISTVLIQGQCVTGRQITIGCAAQDADGTLSSGTISINGGAAQAASLSGGAYSVPYTIPSDATGQAITAACVVTDSNSATARQDSTVCSSVDLCPTTPAFGISRMNPSQPQRDRLLEVSFTSTQALGASPPVSLVKPSGQLLAVFTKDAARSAGNIYVYKAQLPSTYSGDATLVITGSSGDCAGETKSSVFIKSGAAALPSVLEIRANPTEIKTADGRSVITATLKDNAGRPVPYETTIWFEKTKGTLSSASCTTRADESSCFVHLTATNAVEQSVVTAKWNGMSAQTTVRFEPANADNPPGIFNPKPSGTIAPGRRALSVMTDESATCRYSNRDVAFDSVSMTQMTQTQGGIAFVHSSQDIDFAAGAYTYYFKCRDDFGNGASLAHSFSVEAGGGTACTGTAPSDAEGVVKSTVPGTGTWNYRGTGTLGVCEWTCASGFTKSGESCTSGGASACGGTSPAGSPGTIIIGHSNYAAGYTPASWTYAEDASLTTPCKWKCDAGYGQSGSTCVQQTFSCTGTAPSNSDLCSNDNTGLTINTPVTLVGACGAPKCEYRCVSGYARQGNTCISTGETACGAGTLPASLAGVEQGPAVYTGSALSWSYQQSGDLTACRWRCGFGFRHEGNACAPAFAVSLSTTPETPLVNQQFTMDITFAGTAKLFVRGISSGDKICNSS
ncbi:MAG: Ig-like domain-containing protein, partial [Candidatus Aenigmarchaeota archaeon]|nr:Ig-like domain-containing protein [Candidatus Aenigmarchaeota archaeon]